mgnify:CR=1 FL=1
MLYFLEFEFSEFGGYIVIEIANAICIISAIWFVRSKSNFQKTLNLPTNQLAVLLTEEEYVIQSLT